TTELTLLSAGPPPPPPPPPTRDAASRASRANRSGAPLWQVCEFQPHLTLAQCAGLEAALEASGLLDAWIAPDGTLSGDLPCDTFFPTSPPATDALPTHRPTLIDWLRPDLPDTPASPSAALNAETLRAVLTRIAAGPDSGTAHWVALDGRWQLGPVYGRGQKPATVHLGATSREAARLNRIDKLNTQLQALDQRKHALDDEAAQLDARATEAATEHSAVPADDAIATALTLRTEAHRQLDAAKSGYTTAIRKTHRAREDLQQAEDTLNRAVRDLGYAGHLHRLSELRPAWAPYDKATLQVWTAAQAWANSSQEADRLAIRRRTTDEEVTQTAEAAISARTAFLRAAEELSVLTRTLGTSIQDYQNELEAARTARTKAQTALDIAKENHATAIQKRNGYETSLAPAREKITDAETRRTAATLDLRLPLLHGLYTEAHPGLHDIETDDWSPTRAYAIARRLPKDLPDTDLTDTAWNHRINNLNTQINDLRTHTGPLGCQVTSHLLADGLTRVTCHYQGNEHTPALCLAAVERERATRERLLSDGERDIIDRHLVTEVSLQLQALIENARQRTDDINSEMTRCATTLGVTLRLVWEPATEGLPAGLPQVRRLLIADQGAWTTDERATVGNFLHQLINEQRERDPAATATEQLLRALDYRRWHTYAADRHQNNRWERLTRKRYGTGSGGEKALMLTIPQMAAASSHYRSTARHAPRLILLDEAFAGMDKPTRARCMGLLEAFDLDLLMTSEREWGTHASVSGIAIYQLVADTEAIAATRFVWNGRKIVPTIVPDTPELREQQPPPPSSLLAPDFQ
ncbi:MAG: TIGR02680 family protein, partial [Opitutaceae bacterium]|nr:TIGR02680 family protein [Opitutaceae bacterium]